MNGNFVKLHRTILDWEWWSEPNTCKVFIYMILRANWADRAWQGITIKRGSFVSSLKKVAEECGITISQVRTAFEHLQHSNEISLDPKTKYTVFTVTNYDKYQSNGFQTNNVSDNSQDNTPQPLQENPQSTQSENNVADNRTENYSQSSSDKEHKEFKKQSQNCLCDEQVKVEVCSQESFSATSIQSENKSELSHIEKLLQKFQETDCTTENKSQTNHTEKMQENSGFSVTESNENRKQIATNKNYKEYKNYKKEEKKEEDKKEKNSSSIIPEIIIYFNEKAGTAFRVKNKQTEALLQARKEEGFSIEDMKHVIDKKCREWLGTKMQVNLRPEVLFSENHFEQYLNQLEVPVQNKKLFNKTEQKKTNSFHNFEERKYDWDALEKMLLTSSPAYTQRSR